MALEALIPEPFPTILNRPERPLLFLTQGLDLFPIGLASSYTLPMETPDVEETVGPCPWGTGGAHVALCLPVSLPGGGHCGTEPSEPGVRTKSQTRAHWPVQQKTLPVLKAQWLRLDTLRPCRGQEQSRP
jgi:hypothetical protein